jgi:hypothetical protein
VLRGRPISLAHPKRNPGSWGYTPALSRAAVLGPRSLAAPKQSQDAEALDLIRLIRDQRKCGLRDQQQCGLRVSRSAASDLRLDLDMGIYEVWLTPIAGASANRRSTVSGTCGSAVSKCTGSAVSGLSGNAVSVRGGRGARPRREKEVRHPRGLGSAASERARKYGLWGDSSG